MMSDRLACNRATAEEAMKLSQAQQHASLKVGTGACHGPQTQGLPGVECRAGAR